MPSKVLFLAEGQLGDLLLLTPAIRGLKESYPDCVISVLALERRSLAHDGELVRPAEEGNPLFNNPRLSSVYVGSRVLLRAGGSWKRFKTELSVLRFLRAQKFDTVVCTFPEDRFATWAFLSGARIRVGQKNQALRFLLNVTPDITKPDKGVLEYYCDLVRCLGAEVRNVKTEFTIPDKDAAWADQFISKHNLGHDIVIVHPGATGAYKIWPPARFAELIDTVQIKLGFKVLLCSSAYDNAVTGEIRGRLKTRVIEVDTGGNIGRLAALIARSRLCVSNDSGPRHLAVAVETPSLAPFRQYIDREWRIYPEGGKIATIQSENECPHCPIDRCLDLIPPNKTFGSWCMRMVKTETMLSRMETMLVR